MAIMIKTNKNSRKIAITNMPASLNTFLELTHLTVISYDKAPLANNKNKWLYSSLKRESASSLCESA